MLSIVSGTKSEMLMLENQFCKGTYTPFKDQDDEYGTYDFQMVTV